MNCKQGDLAFYVGKSKSQTGRIVRCVSFGGSNILTGPHWLVEPPIVRDRDGMVSKFVLDRALRPIRPSDAPDETLTWAGKPQETTTHRELTKAKA